MVALQSTVTALIFFFLINNYYQLHEVKNNLGDVTKADFIALSMFDIYSETKRDIYVMKNFRVSPISMQKCSEIASGDTFRSKILEGPSSHH